VVRCLNCSEESFKVVIHTYEVPYFGEIIIETGVCSKCGFRKCDVSIAEAGTPKRIVVRVENEKDLNVLVLKSSTAIIKIPELGIEITPGPAAQGYITTIEGILHNVLEYIPIECFDEKSYCYSKVKEINEAIEGRRRFTLIIEDYYGKSMVRGNNIKIIEESL